MQLLWSNKARGICDGDPTTGSAIYLWMMQTHTDSGMFLAYITGNLILKQKKPKEWQQNTTKKTQKKNHCLYCDQLVFRFQRLER